MVMNVESVTICDSAGWSLRGGSWRGSRVGCFYLWWQRGVGAACTGVAMTLTLSEWPWVARGGWHPLSVVGTPPPPPPFPGEHKVDMPRINIAMFSILHQPHTMPEKIKLTKDLTTEFVEFAIFKSKSKNLLKRIYFTLLICFFKLWWTW